ncbi:MAG TPA: hypothetical protein VK184_05940 [Nostocaceae cyanobacterium]|nr:hypothetical protein [Nostocaceae cyanobacterium]
MRVWLACFVLLFVVVELFDWLKQFTLPLPVYILAGAFLAVASNYNQIIGTYFKPENPNTIIEPLKIDASTESNPVTFAAINPVKEIQPSE